MSIVSKPGNDKYREEYDRIFNEQAEEKDEGLSSSSGSLCETSE